MIIVRLDSNKRFIKMATFKLEDREYIELNKLLKIFDLVNSGGEAKIRIRDGEATFNGEIETRVKKKLRVGDVITFDGMEIRIE